MPADGSWNRVRIPARRFSEIGPWSPTR
jgi:hypothetical protein